ncbi:MAG: NADH-quinone oxidoreductase subunit NuoE [Rhizobiales bacterium]|nr:NADH-quinone oxidoreductase subunit NuoE [Hyphomicrobiales bacterium]
MSVRRLHPIQPDSFEFTADNLAFAETLIARYPEGKQASAVIPLLWRAQEQNGGWTSEPAIRCVADMLAMPYIRVLEVATFYTMFQLSPVGRKAHIQVCGTTPCMLRGAEELKAVCRKRIAPEPFAVSADGDFSWEEVECLGACVNAPMVQVWKDTYEDLTPESLEALIEAFAQGRPPAPGPQNGRHFSAPIGGATTLNEVPVRGSGASGVIEAVAKSGSVATAAALGGAAAGGSAVVPGLGGAASMAASASTSPSGLASGADEAVDPDAESAAIAARLAELPADATPEQKANAVGARPLGLASPEAGRADDLKRIKGIGKVNEDRLNGLGIYHFHQIAAWTRPEIRWVTTYLAFPGRIDREDWVGQARLLAEGRATEFSKRVDAGEVESSKG